MELTLPEDIWGKILVFVDFYQRMEVCKLLIDSGCVKITGSIFQTYMMLLEESKKEDEKNFHKEEDIFFWEF